MKVLIIDDDPYFLDWMAECLAREGVEIWAAKNPYEGLDLFLKIRPGIVFVDLVMPELDGLQILDRIIAADPGAEVIVVTAHYSTESAVEAIQRGARDYLAKPVAAEKLRSRVAALIAEAEERKKVLDLDSELVDACRFEGIIGRSPLMFELFSKIRRVAPHFRTLLITGETGTGKELVARALHQRSVVKSGPFVVCNCSAIVETLLESELFGHVRGAFTGATQDKLGVFEYASGGTVFLDEIGELPMESQAKLLRVLQNQEVQRVGSPAPRPVSVRVLAATHRDLRQMVVEGRFREDLYYRLSMIELRVPRLADRREDLPLLERHFVTKFASQFQKPVTGITRRAQVCLARHHWPGNVRELENVVGNACIMTETQTIDLKDLPESVRLQLSTVAGQHDLLSFEELQNRHLLYILERVGGNKVRAAEILGVCRTTVYEMLSKIASDQFSPAAGTNDARIPASRRI